MSASSASAAGLAGRYASALFDLAREQDSLDRVETDLDALAGLLTESRELERALGSPLVKAEGKVGIIKALADKAGFADLTVRFLGVMAARGRLGVLGDIIAAFRAMLAEQRGETSVEVISAIPLEPHQRTAVEEMLKASLGKKVILEPSVDPSLLGGLVLRIGSQLIDASLKTKLRHLDLAMRGAG